MSERKDHVTILVQDSPKLKMSGGDPFAFKIPKFSECVDLIRRATDVTPEYFSWDLEKCKWFITNILLYFRKVEITDIEITDKISKLLKFPENLDDFDDDLLCPISHVLMYDPVRADDGRTYERAQITTVQESTGISPLTRGKISGNFVPDIETKNKCLQQILSFVLITMNPDTGRLERSTLKMRGYQTFGDMAKNLHNETSKNTYFVDDNFNDISDFTALEYYAEHTYLYCSIFDDKEINCVHTKINDESIPIYKHYSIMKVYSVVYDAIHSPTQKGNGNKNIKMRAIDIKLKYGKTLENMEEPEECVKIMNSAGILFDQIYYGDFNFSVIPGFTWKNAIESFAEICEYKFNVDKVSVEYCRFRDTDEIIEYVEKCPPKGIIFVITFGNILDGKFLYQMDIHTTSKVKHLKILAKNESAVGCVRDFTELLAFPDKFYEECSYDYRINNISTYKLERTQIRRLMREYNDVLEVDSGNTDIQLIDGDIQSWYFDCNAYSHGKICEVKVCIYFHIGWPAEPPRAIVNDTNRRNFRHPNVYENGIICLSPWKPETTALKIINDIKETLSFPSIAKIVDLVGWINLSKSQTL